MAKKRASGKKKGSGTGRASRTSAFERKRAAARAGSLHEWLEGVRAFASTKTDGGAPTGACLVSDPAGGPAMCISTDRETCKLMKGTFLGGPC